MSDTNTGGPAFPSGLIDPSTPENTIFPVHRGISTRDYFAAKAMQVYMDGVKWNADSYAGAAKASYNVADAMLKARNAK
jgi:hypothetical protein